MTACRHDWIRHVLDDSTASREQQDGVDGNGRPYRDVPMWPTAVFAYAATIGSNFAARVVEMKCCDCGAQFDAHMARVSDPLLKRG